MQAGDPREISGRSVLGAGETRGMTEIEASRTLVKSPPELWAECSEASNLARHLGQFGEIKITRLEPENAVAWEGTLASGTVRLEPSGWGTKVILTAQQLEPASTEAPEATVEPEAEEPGPDIAPEPMPVAPPPPPQPRQGGLLGRLFGRFRAPQPVAIALEPPAPAPVAVAPEPEPEPEPVAVAPEPEPVVVPDVDHEAVLVAALDSLGQAHHRPFSRD
jgi:hypothetical protein